MDDQAAKRAPKAGGRRSTEHTKRAILLAAQKEFSQQGYSGARIEKIAQIAKCNVRMIYHYFDSKKNLYVAVLEGAYEDLRARNAACKSTSTSARRLPETTALHLRLL